MPGFPDWKSHSFPQFQVRIESRILRLSTANLAIRRMLLLDSHPPTEREAQPRRFHIAISGYALTH